MSKNQNQNKNQAPVQKTNSEIKPKDDGKSFLLKFEKDAFYNGQLVYSKGVHRVETKDGWAARWMARGAFKVDSMDSLETSSVALVPEVPVVLPQDPPQDLGQGENGQGADTAPKSGDTESGKVEL